MVLLYIYANIWGTSILMGSMAMAHHIWQHHASNSMSTGRWCCRMGPPVDSVQLVYKWLNSMVYGRYNYS